MTTKALTPGAPVLLGYDVIVVNSSAGKDSQAMLDLVVEQADEWLPILDWSVAEVWARIHNAGTRHHWAYDAGMPRLSCSFCVLASRSALVRAAQLRPELAAEYAGLERRINHRFRRDLSMAEIIAEAESCGVQEIQEWAA